MLDKKKLLENKVEYFRSGSYGTEKYYKHFGGLLYTDGVKEMCEKLGAYWFIDIVASYIPKYREKDTFGVARFHVDLEDSSGVFFIDNGNNKVYRTQEVEYTDLEINLKVYIQDNGKYWVACMPEEY